MEFNDIIIKDFLEKNSNSKESINTKKSSLNYFFDKKYFGYLKPIKEIQTKDIVNYFQLSPLSRPGVGPRIAPNGSLSHNLFRVIEKDFI